MGEVEGQKLVRMQNSHPRSFITGTLTLTLTVTPTQARTEVTSSELHHRLADRSHLHRLCVSATSRCQYGRLPHVAHLIGDHVDHHLVRGPDGLERQTSCGVSAPSELWRQHFK